MKRGEIMHSRRVRVKGLVAVAVSCLVAAACSSSTKSGTSAGTTAGSAGTAVGASPSTSGASSGSSGGGAKGPIKLGAIETATLEGGPGPFADFYKGAEARFAAANQAGGIDGRMIDFPAGGVQDDGGSATTFDTAARQLVLSDHVFGVLLGSYAPFSTSFLEQNKIISSGPGVWYTQQCHTTYAIPYTGCVENPTIGSSWSQQIPIDMLGPAKGKSYAFVISDGQLSPTLIEIEAALEAGFDVCYAQSNVPLSSVTSWTPWVTSMMKCSGGKGPSILNVALPTLEDTTGLVDAMRAAGWQGTLTIDGTYYPNLSPAAAASLKGAIDMVFTTVPSDFSDPSLTNMENQLAAIGFSPAHGPWDTGLEEGYASADFLVQLFNRVGGANLTPDAVAHLLQTGWTYPGLPGLVPSVAWPAGYTYGESCASALTIEANGTYKPYQPTSDPLICTPIVHVRPGLHAIG